MAIPTSANFDSEHEKTLHAPVYICEIVGIGGADAGSGSGGFFGGLIFGEYGGSGGSGSSSSSIKFATALMAGFYACETPMANFPEIDPDLSTSSLGSIAQPIKDIDGIVTALLAIGLKGRSIVFKCGYWPQDESDFAVYATYIIDDFDLMEDGMTWVIQARDPNTLANITVFEGAATKLWRDIDASETTIPVRSAQFFLSSGSFIIDGEMFLYGSRARDITNVFWEFSGVTRGAENTIAAAHLVDAPVSEVLIIEGHPMDLAVQVMTATDKTGAGISPDMIDLDAFEDAKFLVGASIEMKFYITEAENLKSWLEQEIYRPTACYPRVTGAGLISIVAFRQPTPSRVVGVIDDNEITSLFPGLRGNQDSLRNTATCLGDWDPINREFASSLTYEDVASIALYGKRPITRIESKGFRFDQGTTERFVNNRLKARVKRYRNGAFILPLRTRFHTFLFEAGDIVEVTCAVVPNALTGTRGIVGQLLEVRHRGVDFASGEVTFDLEWTAWFGTAAIIAPAGTGDYTSASTWEKENYMWIADDAGLLPGGVPAPTIADA